VNPLEFLENPAKGGGRATRSNMRRRLSLLLSSTTAVLAGKDRQHHFLNLIEYKRNLTGGEISNHEYPLASIHRSYAHKAHQLNFHLSRFQNAAC
jgi:hypothetical protein